MLETDFYKICHVGMYPEKMNMLYETWTPRTNKYFPYSDKVVFYGLQMFIKKFLIETFNKEFFNKTTQEIIDDYDTIVHKCFDPDIKSENVMALHKLGYLPIRIEAVPEGTIAPIGTPLAVAYNTHPDFAWLSGYLETPTSCNMWQPSTAATISKVYNDILREKLTECGEDPNLASTLYGDFSPRGMCGLEAGAISGSAHLLCSTKTSSPLAIKYLMEYYNADIENETIGQWSHSVEHSVIEANYFLNGNSEEPFFEKLIDRKKPFTYVADTFDFWGFVTETLPKFKDKITYNGKTVFIRPDSGDPFKMLCGDPDADTWYERKGLIEILWDLFGGTVNKLGFKKLAHEIRAVYGDSITMERCRKICDGLIAKGFCVSNVIFGVGSYTYQMISRDTLGHAYKATYCEVDSKPIMMFKSPKTDPNKKSQKGCVVVYEDENGNICYKDSYTFEEAKKQTNNIMRPVFIDGKLYNEQTLSEIRNRIGAI
jgi:nicotinamide phosphoribosyltransferase